MTPFLKPRHQALAAAAVLSLLAAWALYRGLRAPSRWSACYYQLSWLDGFSRRGLVGTLLLPWGCARFDPWFIRLIQVPVLGLSFALLLLLGSLHNRLGMALFLAGHFGAYHAHLIGYPEHLVLLLGAAAAWLDRRGRPGAAGFLLALACLVHELALFTALPALLLLRLRRAPGAPPARLYAPTLATIAGLAVFSSPIHAETVLNLLRRSADCGWLLVRPDYFYPFAEPLASSIKNHYGPDELLYQVFPFILASGLWVLSGAARPSDDRPRRLLTWLACLVPLLLGLVAWDKGRWIGLGLLLTVLLAAPAAAAWTLRRSLLGLPLALVLLFVPVRYFDGYHPRPLHPAALRGFPAEIRAEFERLPAR